MLPSTLDGGVPMTLDGDETGQWVPLREAAAALHLNEKSVRRRIRAGTLRAHRVESPYGPAWQVWLGGGDPAPSTVNGHDGEAGRQGPSTLDDTPGESGRPAGAHDETPSLLEALRMIERQQQTIMELAGRVGFYQAQVQQLQAALEAPREFATRVADSVPEPAPPETAPEPTSEGEAIPRPSTGLWSRLAGWFGG